MDKPFKPKVLIVDDNKRNLQVLGNILHEEFEVAMAIDGAKAIKIANQIIPDIIILDIMMPGMNGFDVIRILKADEATKEIPVIFLTAKVELDDVIQGFTEGAVDYVTKPFKKQELLVRIKNHLDLVYSKRKIIEQANKLKAANDFKDKMFSIIGHDLRSPLSSIKLTFDLILGGIIKVDDDDFSESLNGLAKSTDEAFVLLENLLGWAKSESGTMKVVQEEILIQELAESIKRLNKHNLENKSIDLVIENNATKNIWADNQMINTVLRNLVSNATKFTPENGTITINAKDENDNVVISVSDTGVGIPPENLDKLFNNQGTVKTYGTNNEPGTGLGLILCKDFVIKNGGEIGVKSVVGEGSTFYFTIPAKQ